MQNWLVSSYYTISFPLPLELEGQTHFPAKPSFDQKSSLMIFSGTLNFFRLMIKSSYSIIGRIGSSGTIVIFPLFASPSEETSTVSSLSRIVRLFFYLVSLGLVRTIRRSRKRDDQLTIACSAWFGHIHFLPLFGVTANGGFKQSKCHDKEQ